MPSSVQTREAAVRTTRRGHAIALVVLLSGVVLTVVLYGRFNAIVELVAPAFVGLCVLVVVCAVTWLKVKQVRAARQAAENGAVEVVIAGLAARAAPRTAADIGRSWRTLEAARVLTAQRGESERAVIHRALRASDAWKPVAQRAMYALRRWERVRALQDLGWLGVDEAMPVVCRALADEDDDAAWAAVVALGGMRNDVAYEVLLDQLTDGRFAASRVAQVLETGSHPDPVPLLRARVRSASPTSLFWMAYLLGCSGNAEAVGLLLELSRHPDADVRANAAEALGRTGDSTAADALLVLVRDEQWFVRLHACRALGDLAVERAWSALAAAARDTSWWVRRAAIEALRRIRADAA